MNPKLIKILGSVISISGAALSLASDYISNKQISIEIEEKVAEAVAKIVK